MAMSYANRDDQRTYQRIWRNRRRDEWLNANGLCRQCGSWEELEIDHIDPQTKATNPSHLWSYAEDVRLVELAKCQVLCRACHLAKTNAYKIPGHGTKGMYNKHRCRCDTCRSAHAQRARDYRAKRASGRIRTADPLLTRQPL